MKKYNVPATEVVAFMSEAMIMAGSPTSLNPNPNDNDPSNPSAGTGGGGPIGN